MKLPAIGLAILRPLLLGALLGGVITLFWFSEKARKRQDESETRADLGWVYLKIDDSGWSTGPVDTLPDLEERLARLSVSSNELVLPVFPTVFRPAMVDKLYYDGILESQIQPGAKVLVVGAGSGADAWVAALKSQAPVYVVEINPIAVANTTATARLGRFEIKPVVGDIRTVDLPDDFTDFDHVLWNMPFLWNVDKLEHYQFHDGDDGSVLRAFLGRLPRLLKKGGTAIVLNHQLAEEFITTPGVTVSSNRHCTLFIIPNP